MKTGDILLVHTNSTMGKIIQKFQMKKDKEAGYYNHSGIIYVGKHRVWVAEEAEIEGRKLKAAAVFTPLEEYTNRHECDKCGWAGAPTGLNEGIDKKCPECGNLKIEKSNRYDLLLLEHTVRAWVDEVIVEETMFPLMGIPYDYHNLLVHQIRRLVSGIWTGRNTKKAWRRMVCHEFTQYVWHKMFGIFPEYNQASVSAIFRSKYFKHTKI